MTTILRKNIFNVNKIAKVVSTTINEKVIKIEENPFWEFVFIEKEEISINSPTYNGTLSKNQMILFEPNTCITISAIDGKKANVILISFESENNELQLFCKDPTTVPISIQNHLFRTLKEYSFLQNESDKTTQDISNSPFGSSQLLYQNLEYFFIMEIRKKLLKVDYKNTSKHTSIQKNEFANTIADYIDKHITENITNKQLCSEFCITRTTLCKLFYESYGVTLIKYINQAKIQVAKSLIREGEMNFTEIAEYLSFSSIHYFCKLFTKYENQTPTEYSKTVTSYIEKK